MTSSIYDPPPRPPDRLAPVIGWDTFMSHVFDWHQDEHIGVVGPNGMGKTNLVYHLLDLRRYVTYMAIKPHDKTLDAFARHGGYKRIETWPPTRKRLLRRAREVTAEEMPRRLLWPDATELDSEDTQRRVFSAALDDIYRTGAWCTVLDDFWYMAHILGFERQTKKYLANARSNDIPMVVAAQRPAGNRLVELFDQTSHLFFFGDNDEPNLKRISGVGSQSSKAIQGFVANLDRWQTLYVNTRDRFMYRTTAPELKFSRKG